MSWETEISALKKIVSSLRDSKADKRLVRQADWNQTNSSLPDFIKNKPVIGGGGAEADPIFTAWLATNPFASYQPHNASLDALAALSPVNHDLIEYDGTASVWATLSRATAIANFASVGGYELVSRKGVANGYVPLNSSTLIDQVYLPSYVDDILEYANLAAFPATGETGKIYIAISPSNKQYRWTGSAYIAITNGLIGSTTDVPEGTFLYFTNARAIAAPLTGYASGAGVVAATDTILQAIQKLNGNDALKLTTTLPSANIFVGNVANVATAVAMSGEASINNAGAVTVANSAVINKVITGYASGAGVVAATDTILQAIQKLNGNIAALGTPMTNPMNAVGDMIVGGAVVSGVATPSRLAIGTNNYFMKSNGTTAAWADLFGAANTWSAKQTFSASAAILLSNTTNASNHIQSYLSVNSIGNYVNHLYCTDSLGIVKSAIRTTCGNGGATPYLSFHVNSGLTEYFRVNGITGANHSLVKMYFGDGTTTPTALAHLAGSTTSAASLRIVSGTAPTSPNDGDIWFDGTNLKMRIGGVTKTFTIV